MQMKRMGGVGLFAKSCLTLCDPWTVVAHQASRSMGFSRQEYRGGLPFPSPGHLPRGVEPASLMSPAGRWVLSLVPSGKPKYSKYTPINFFLIF